MQGAIREIAASPKHELLSGWINSNPSPPRKALFDDDIIRVAVAAILSPTGTIDSYTPLITYLEDVLGKPVKLVQRRTYKEINELLSRGSVDVAFVCTGAYIEGVKED